MEQLVSVLVVWVGFMLFCFYKMLTYSALRSNTSKRFRYHVYWTSGIRNHEDYKFKSSWFDKRSVKSIARGNGIGWHRIIDSRTGNVVAEYEPSPENREHVERINRVVDDIRWTHSRLG